MRQATIAAVITAALCLGTNRTDAAAPTIVWASDPVGPDEMVVLTGDGFGDHGGVEFSRLADGPPAEPPGGGPWMPSKWTPLAPAQSGNQCVKFVVPAGEKAGVYACRVRGPGGVSNTILLNAPDPWWLQGDLGEAASPGGWLRIFGKCLGPGAGGTMPVVLISADGKPVRLTAQAADGYALKVGLPQDLLHGAYTVHVHNGFGGVQGWREAGRLDVRARPEWKPKVFNVKDFGPKPGEALLAALKKAKANGGGIVHLPRGRYPVKSTLAIPDHTLLRGEAMELVSLYWPDFDAPPAELVSGANFGLEALTLYCQNHKNVVADTPQSTRVVLRRVRIRANCYFMIEDVGREFRGRQGPSSHRQCGAAVLLRGANFEVVDCDIYASNYGLRLLKARPGVVAGNRIRYGGRGYSIENADRLIFENNTIAGNNLLSIGNDITTFWTNACQQIYFAHNRLEQMFGADREMMTLDAGGGAYYGRVAAVDGPRLTLATDPVFRDYAPRPHTDWRGAAVMILDGRGAGQYRLVTRHVGRRWEVDRPWLVPPDSTSRISIAPFRGRNLFIGNMFEDGGAFQLYGAALDSVVAGNQGARMDGFLVWGLNPHGWGQQPSWCCQFLDNEILEGNAYGHRAGFFGTTGGDDPQLYDGPMLRAIVFRRNHCRNNASFRLGGTLADALVEHCSVRDSHAGIDVGRQAVGVLLRDNRLENVTRPYLGEGLPAALRIEGRSP